MPAGDDYRIKAADINAKAKGETNSRARWELQSLALAYLRLADQADRNADLAPWTDLPPSTVQQQQQQRQPQPQPQPNNKTDAEKK